MEHIVKTLFTRNEMQSLGHQPDLRHQSHRTLLKWRALLTSETIVGGGAITLLTNISEMVDDPFVSVIEWHHTVCGSCSFGCGLEIGVDNKGRAVVVRGNGKHPANAGHICVNDLYRKKILNNKAFLVRDSDNPARPLSAKLSH